MAIGLAIWAGITFATFIAGKYMQEHAKRKALRRSKGEFDANAFPILTEAAPLPILLGTIRINPAMVWYWVRDGGAAPVTETYYATNYPYNSYENPVGWKYGASLHFILCCAGRTNDHDVAVQPAYTQGVTNFWIGEKKFADLNANDAILSTPNTVGSYFNKPNFFGGQGKGGGADGYVAWHEGESNTVNPGVYTDWEAWKNLIALALSLGESGYDSHTPNYRYSIGVCLKDFYFGESPMLPPVSFTARCLPNYGNSIIESRVSNTLGPDANPAAIVYTLLTNTWFGIGLTAAQVDTASFHAVGQTLNTEGFGLTVLVTGETSPKDLISEVLEHIDAVIWEDHATGTVKIKLIREDYVVANITQLDETNVVEVEEYSATSWEDTYNLVRINYTDRAKNYKTTSLAIHDQANFTFQSNKIRVIDLKFPYCMTATVARKILDRELRTYSLPRRAIRLTVTREALELVPGSVFKLDWLDYDITGMVWRVTQLDLGTLDKNTVTIEAVQDVFDAVRNTHSNSEDDNLLQTDLDLPAPVRATQIKGRDIGVIELPSFFLDQLEDQNLFVDPNRISKIMFVFTPTVAADKVSGSSYQVEMSINGGDVKLAENSLLFHDYAQVDTYYPFDTDSYDTAVGLIIKNVSNPALLAAATVAEIREFGQNLIMVNGEFLSFETVTDNLDGTYTLGNVWRELLDTSARDLEADDVVVFLTPRSLHNVTKSIFNGDETISLTARSYNGVSLSDEATYSNFDLDKRPLLPAPPQNVKVRFDNMDPNVQSSHTRTVVEINTDPEIDFTWNQRTRLAGAVVRGDDASVSPEDGTLYEIQAKHRYDNAWTTIATAIAAGTTASAWVNELLPYGDTELRIQAYRDIDITGVTDTRYSFDGPIVRFDNAYYRQLLKSPNGNNRAEGWTVTNGTWSHNFASTPLWGAVGTVIKQTTTGAAEYVEYQVVDIEDMHIIGSDCGSISLSFYVMADAATAHQYKVSLEVLKADGTTAVTTEAVSNVDVWTVPSTGTWDYVTVTSNTNFEAAKIRVKLRVNQGDAVAPQICFTRLDLRMGAISTNQATNGDFTTNLSGWSTAVGTWAWDNTLASLRQPDLVGGFATSTDGTDNAELYQDIDVPDAYSNFTGATPAASYPGNSHVLVKWAQGSALSTETEKVIVEARALDQTVLASIDSGFLAQTEASRSWRYREVALELPDDTAHVRVRLVAEGEGALGNSAFDKVEVIYAKFVPLMVASAQQMEDRLGYAPALLWKFDVNSTATAVNDLVAATPLTENNTSVSWAASNTASNHRCLRFNSTSYKVEASASSVFQTALTSFAVYLEFSQVDLEGDQQGNLISKCDANGLGWRVTYDNEMVTFSVNNGTTQASVTAATSTLRNPYANQFLFVCKKTADGYLDLSMTHAAYYGADVQCVKVAGSVTAADFTAFGDFTNTGILTMGANAYTAGAAWENDAVTGINYIQMALFSGANAEQFVVGDLERLRLSKGYRNTAI